MKNLKKILMAFALVALIISSVVTVAIAETSYTGSVDSANALIEEVYSASNTEAKAEKLAEVYDYLSSKPIDPEAEGYDGLIAEYNALAFKTAYIRSGDAESASGNSELAEVLTKVYLQLADAPVILAGRSDIKTDAEDVEFSTSYICTKCWNAHSFSEAELLSATVASACSECGKDGLTFNKVAYSDFEKALNSESLYVAELLLGKLFSASGDDFEKGYYALLLIDDAIDSFLENLPDEGEYPDNESELYTGSVVDVTNKLLTVNVYSSADELKTALADVYNYLVATPVNPTTAAYYEFITKYDTLCGILMDELVAEINAETSYPIKMGMLSELREYLMGSAPDVKGTPLSEKVVERFNELRLEIIEELEEYKEILSELEEIDFEAPSYEYVSDATAFNEKMNAIAKIAEKNINDANVAILLCEVYDEFILNKAYDPKAEGYIDSIKIYSELSVKCVEARFVNRMNELKHMEEKHNLIIEFNKFVNDTPLCEEVVIMYNDTREEFYNECKAIAELITSADSLKYAAPSEAEPTVTVALLRVFLDDLSASYEKYVSASAEAKAAALEEMKLAAAEIRTTIVGSVIDTDGENYAQFQAEYDALRTNVVNALLTTVDEAETREAKLAALKALKDYLLINPLTREAVEGYNAKALELGAGADMQLTSIYFDIDAVIAAVANGTLEQKLSGGKALKDFKSLVFDVTDPAYEAFVAQYDDAMAVIAEALYIDVTETLSNKQLLAAFSEYVAYAREMNSVSIIESLKNAANRIGRVCEIITVKMETSANFARYETGYENAYKIIEEFGAAEDFDSRLAALEELSAELNGDRVTVYYMAGPSYAYLMGEYDRMAALLESELMGMVESAATPDDLFAALTIVKETLEELPFSQTLADRYNAEINVDYSVYIESSSACEYKTPDGWNRNLARITIALNRKTAEGFYVAYNVLAGVYGLPLDGVLEDPKVTDFGVSGFVGVIGSLNSARADILENYSEQEELGFGSYEQIADVLAAHLEAFDIDTDLLNARDKGRYDNLQSFKDIVKYSVIDGYFNKYERLDGNLDAQKAAVGKLKAYVDKYGKIEFSEASFVQTVLEYTFINFLDEFDGKALGLSQEQKAEATASLEAKLLSAKFPSNLISIYNARYSKQLVAAEIAKATEAGSLIGFVEKILLLEGEEEEELDALSALVAYVNGSVFNKANLGATISTELEKISKEIDAGSGDVGEGELTETETAFITNVQLLLNKAASAIARLDAYNAAMAVKNSVGSACSEYKELLVAFDITEIEALAVAEHFEKLKMLANNIVLDSMTSLSAPSQKGSIDALNAYMETYKAYIDQTSDEVFAIKNLVSEASAKVTWFEGFVEYVDAIKKFHRATSLTSMTKYLEVINSYYETLNLAAAENTELAEKDPTTSELIRAILSDDPKVTAILPQITLDGYYKVYIPARTYEQLRYENSAKAIDCIAFIEKLITNKDELTEEAYYQALLAKVDTDFDIVEPYVTTMRKIIVSGIYDSSMAGMKEALAIFEVLNSPVYEILQTAHLEVIKSQLDKYNLATSYIEKLGICTYLENYILTNDVDTDRALCAQYVHLLEVYKAELESYKSDYDAILAANTQSFIGIVEKMGAYVTYSELKPLYDEAINKYYYNMNIDSDEVKAASEKFAEYEALLEEWEYNGAVFMGYVENLNSARRRSQTFRALTNCKAYIDLVDVGVKGVAAAVADYNEALAEYQEWITPVNSEISQSTDVVCSLRSNSVASTILAVVKAIIGK
jgi:DNA-directed RNA polymerase subunit RPC12/RpoP